jgi:hypothetical protein
MAVIRDDPYSAINFQVTIEGILEDGRSVRGSFAEVSGLDVTITPIEYRNGCAEVGGNGGRITDVPKTTLIVPKTLFTSP